MVAIVARRPAALADAELAASAVALPVFLFAFSQTVNFQHGATPGMSRYALWLLPLTLRLFDLARSEGRARAWLEPWAALSFLVCLVAYHPSVAEGRVPTVLRVALAVDARARARVRPLPEMFSETVRGDDGGIQVPVAMPGCEKVLLQGGPRERPMWPVPCYPAVVPDACRQRRRSLLRQPHAARICVRRAAPGRPGRRRVLRGGHVEPGGRAHRAPPARRRGLAVAQARLGIGQLSLPASRGARRSGLGPSVGTRGRPGHEGNRCRRPGVPAASAVHGGCQSSTRETGAEIGWAAVQGPSFEPVPVVAARAQRPAPDRPSLTADRRRGSRTLRIPSPESRLT